jgi:hypothetical protein
MNMEIVAHGLWAAAAGITAKRTSTARVSIGWSVWWTAFPDVLAFGPLVAIGLWLRLVNGTSAPEVGHVLPRMGIRLPLYPAGHSLIVFLLVFGVTTIFARRIVYSLLGWLLHIVIDVPTHSFSYYATRFLWPVSGFRIDGIAWGTPWFWAATYVALGLVYGIMWRKRWLARSATASAGTEAGERARRLI